MSGAESPTSSGISVAVRVVEKVAEHENIEATELPPLADSINPDALNALFSSFHDATATEAHFSFNYIGHTVHIYANHSVELE